MLELNEMKLKGLNDYIINESKFLSNYDDLLNESLISTSSILLEERKSLLATYLYMIGKKEKNGLMKLLNYQQTEKYNVDLFGIVSESMINNKNKNDKVKSQAVIEEIVEQIIENFLLNEEMLDQLTITINHEEDSKLFLSYRKTLPLITKLLNKYEVIYDIRMIMEKIVLSYKKIARFEWISLKEIHKYETYYSDEDLTEEENFEILYEL